MTTKGKVRIYDLARNLVPEHLSEKERKNLQSKKTKQIIDICEKLGYQDKTPSSSIDGDLVSKVLVMIGGDNSSQAEGTEKTVSKVAIAEAPKKSRVLRRLPSENSLPVKEKTPEPSTPAVEEVTTPPPIEEVSPPEPPAPPQPPEVIEQPKPEAITPPPPVISTPVPSKPLFAPSGRQIPEPMRPGQPRPKEEPKRSFEQQNQNAQRGNGPQPQPQPTTEQPYRVAKPINSTFNIRRKPPAPVRKPQAKPGAQQKNNLARDKQAADKAKPTELVLTHPVTVKELASLLKVQETEIIRNLFLKGIMRTVNQTLEIDLTTEVAADLGCKIIMSEEKHEQGEDLASRLKELVGVHTGEDELASLSKRPPVVTIMGHVDHGKTTLLDAIRKVKLKITSTESGGITQHIGAYQINVVDYDGKTRKVTFLDTPGHEAFTALRARGAQVTDIAILVVAADDGVMPQTVEAISHAKAAGVPIIVAVNKVDKPDSNPDRVLTQLIEHELVVEDYGGPVVCSKISAKQNLNLEDLLTKITLVADAELGDKLLANPSSPAVGAVIEAALSPNRGPVATLLVQSGTLRKGDSIAAGTSYGRVRAIFDDIGNEITVAPPSTPVQILGLDILPQAGDTFRIFKNMQEAKAFASDQRDKANELKRSKSRGLEFFSSQVREGSAKELPVIIKADVQGSAEAIANELNKLSTDQVRIRIVHCAAGAVNENDINLASATNSIVVNFNSVLDGAASKASTDQNVPVYTFNIIYQVTDAIIKAINGLLEPEKVEVKHGQAEIRQVFPAGKNKIAGCYVTEGKLVRGSMAKIIRNRKEIASMRMDSLKRFKDDAKEVLESFECGVAFDGFNDLEVGDIIESWGVEFQERSI